MADQRRIKEIIIICKHCHEPFDSAIFFGTVQAYESAVTSGNMQQCPHCRQLTPCNRENMSYTLA